MGSARFSTKFDPIIQKAKLIVDRQTFLPVVTLQFVTAENCSRALKLWCLATFYAFILCYTIRSPEVAYATGLFKSQRQRLGLVTDDR